jgi:hypothetical protein
MKNKNDTAFGIVTAGIARPLADCVCTGLLCQLLPVIVSGSRTGPRSQNLLQAPGILESLNLPIPLGALGISSNKETSAPAIAYEAISHSKIYLAELPTPKRTTWMPEEDKKVYNIRKAGYS